MNASCLWPSWVARGGRFASAAVFLWALVGCASGPNSETRHVDSPVEACQRWYADLDSTVHRLGVEDAQDSRMEGFPQLRQSRFSASFRDQARQSDAAFDAWFGQMRELGDEGRLVEMANVPEVAWQGLLPPGGTGGKALAFAKTQACADVLSQKDLSQPMRRAKLLALPGVSDSYSTLARFLGAYAFTRWPFSAGVNRWQEETQNSFSTRITREGGAVQRHVPNPSAVDEVANALAGAPRDALGVPQLSAELSQRLLDRHAPVLETAPQGGFDQFGEMNLSPDGRPTVDTAKPVVYRRVAFARQGGATLVQLVYLYWFSERPKTGPLDLLGGALDGVMWRVTLDEKGTPLVYDSAHACGCYHLFFPTPALQVKPAPEAGMEWAFVPAQAPALGSGERVVLGLAPRTHYLSALSTTADFQGATYENLDALQLRSMPLARQGASNGAGDRRSLYGPDGIVPGSQRGERYFFWPMGVRDAGAQRQWGHHATAFVGRRHFDDPDLIERRFERSTETPTQAPGALQR
jgi:hypothetical protein